MAVAGRARSFGPDRDARQRAAGRGAQRGGDRRRSWRCRRLADALERRTARPGRRARARLDRTGGMSRIVGQQVVGERRVEDLAVARPGSPPSAPGRDPGRCRPRSGPRRACGFIALPTSCAVASSHHPDQARARRRRRRRRGGRRTRTGQCALPWPSSSSGYVGAWWYSTSPRSARRRARRRGDDARRRRRHACRRRSQSPSCTSTRRAPARPRARLAGGLAPRRRSSWVCREAELEPAEPTAVSAGVHHDARRRRARCGRSAACTVTRPWPTSAAAVCTVGERLAPVALSRTRAVE